MPDHDEVCRMIARAREIDREATPGPWFWTNPEHMIAESLGTIGDDKVIMPFAGARGLRLSVSPADMRFITMARRLLPALADALEQAVGHE